MPTQDSEKENLAQWKGKITIIDWTALIMRDVDWIKSNTKCEWWVKLRHFPNSPMKLNTKWCYNHSNHIDLGQTQRREREMHAKQYEHGS